MAAFPPIQAQERFYSLPVRPASELQQFGGVRVVWLHGPSASNAQITIVFPACTLAVADSITAHFLGQRQHDPFPIDTAQWQSHDSLYDLAPYPQLYRYLAAPSREYRDGLYDVTIQITTFY